MWFLDPPDWFKKAFGWIAVAGVWMLSLVGVAVAEKKIGQAQGEEKKEVADAKVAAEVEQQIAAGDAKAQAVETQELAANAAEHEQLAVADPPEEAVDAFLKEHNR